MDTVENSNYNACIVCNGVFAERENARELARNCDLLIGADGGADYIYEIGLAPDVIIGDMDSIRPETVERSQSVKSIKYSGNEGKSDAELAVDYAFGQGCQQVMLMAATGGRLDHTLANTALVGNYPGRIAILDGKATLIAVDEREKCRLHGHPGSSASLVAFPPAKTRIKTHQLQKPLNNEPLACASQGLNNKLLMPGACVCVSEGVVFVYIEN